MMDGEIASRIGDHTSSADEGDGEGEGEGDERLDEGSSSSSSSSSDSEGDDEGSATRTTSASAGNASSSSSSSSPALADASLPEWAPLVLPLLRARYSFEAVGVGGLDKELSQLFRRVVTPRLVRPKLRAALNLQLVRGVLLHGPPGTGKDASQPPHP